jgi:ribonucleoside-diphosphate reductase alpha chain
MHNLTEFGAEIFDSRYTLFPGETWEEACKRVATHVAMAERYDDTKTIRDEFYNILIDNHFMPAGRIWAGAGRPKANLLNCFILPPTSDSREGWGQAIKDVIIIAGMGGGVGLNCSEIRPHGDPIKGTGGIAGGPLAFMEILNSMGEVIRASGGRRMALLLGLQMNHPDISAFISAKADHSRLNNANVSVMIPPNGAGADFYKAVKKDGDYPLMWNDRVRSSVKAKELWQTVVNQAITTAEPGIINLHLMNKMNNIWYYKPIVCTNPCGEIPGEPYGACDLGSIVLPKFVNNGKMDWDKLASVVKTSVRFLDNVIDVTNYPLSEIEVETKQVRRIGIGVTGLHDCLILLGHEYDYKGIDFVEKLMTFIRDEAYKASCDLAAKKGAFPIYNHTKYMESEFIKELPPHIKGLITQKGIRNATLLTIAPTGTTSIVCGTSSGIEPIFSLGFKRTIKTEKGKEIRHVIHPLIDTMQKQKMPIQEIKTTHSIDTRVHLEMQKVCQKCVDSSIAKTINLPANVLKDKPSQVEISDLLLEYIPHLKGVTLYTDGCRGDAPIQGMSLDDILKLSCPTGVCSI